MIFTRNSKEEQQMKLKNMKLSQIGQGALQELFENELEKVIDNINDINTEPTKKRKITLTVEIKSDESREILFADVHAKSNLVSMPPTSLKLFNMIDDNGERVVNELKSGVKGQAFIDDDGTVKNDDGSKIEEVEKVKSNNKVHQIYK